MHSDMLIILCGYDVVCIYVITILLYNNTVDVSVSV